MLESSKHIILYALNPNWKHKRLLSFNHEFIDSISVVVAEPSLAAPIVGKISRSSCTTSTPLPASTQVTLAWSCCERTTEHKWWCHTGRSWWRVSLGGPLHHRIVLDPSAIEILIGSPHVGSALGQRNLQPLLEICMIIYHLLWKLQELQRSQLTPCMVHIFSLLLLLGVRFLCLNTEFLSFSSICYISNIKPLWNSVNSQTFSFYSSMCFRWQKNELSTSNLSVFKRKTVSPGVLNFTKVHFVFWW